MKLHRNAALSWSAWGSETQPTSVVPEVREVASSICLRIGRSDQRRIVSANRCGLGMFDVDPVNLIFARAREPISRGKCPSRSA
jgi:hypothetical protein